MSVMIPFRDGFERYRVQTEETPALLIVAVGLFVVLSIALAAPLACWSRERVRRKQYLEHMNEIRYTTGAEEGHVVATIPEDGYPGHLEQQDSFRELGDVLIHVDHRTTQKAEESAPPNVADLAVFHNEHLEAMKQIAIERRMGKLLKPNSTTVAVPTVHSSFPQTLRERILRENAAHTASQQQQAADKVSAVPSVATTSRLPGRQCSTTALARKKLPLKSRLPWSHGRPLPRSEIVSRSVLMERQSATASEEGSHLNSHHNHSWGQQHAGSATAAGAGGGGNGSSPRSRVVSEAAGLFLDRHGIDGEADFYRQRYRNQKQPPPLRANSTVSRGSNRRSTVYSRNGGTAARSRSPPSLGGSASDIGSVMPPLSPDALSPQDAADADDPGRSLPQLLPYETYYNAKTATTETMSHSRDLSGLLSAQFLNILDVAEPDFQCQRLLQLAWPTTIAAMAEPLHRIILVAIVSHFIDTDSMVAYLLVILFIRLTTEEISGAIADAESNMIQDALAEGSEFGFYQAGQAIQLAIFFQVVIGAPVLLMWFFAMEGVVQWLVGIDRIATIASAYTGVIIIDYIIRGASRSFLLPFHLTGQAQFERNIDLIATIMTGAAIAIVASTNDLKLTSIGWIQVIIGIAKAITKVGYVCLKGWLKPYHCGFLKDLACRVRVP
jgi:hypothetical protein